MNGNRHMEELLKDVFRDEKLEALEASLHARSLEELARKRRRPMGWWLLAAAAIFLIATLRMILWVETQRPGTFRNGAPSTKPYYIATAPLSPDQRVAPSMKADVVRTSTRHDLVVRSNPTPNAVSTDPASPVTPLTDDEMLAMFSGIPCGLAEKGGGQKAFFFIQPEDEERFVGNIGG